MTELMSLALLPASLDVASVARAATLACERTGEPRAHAEARIARTRFVAERLPVSLARGLLGDLSNQGLAVVLLPTARVLPPPRGRPVQGVRFDGADVLFRLRGEWRRHALVELLHGFAGSVGPGARRPAQRRSMQARTDQVAKPVLLLYFRGGSAYRLELLKPGLLAAPGSTPLEARRATSTFLQELLGAARSLQRPLLPADVLFGEGLSGGLWGALTGSSEELVARARWWYALAANQRLPNREQLSADLKERCAARPAADNPGMTARLRRTAGERLMEEARGFDRRGQAALAVARYRHSIETCDSFEARIGLIEAVVDSDPFEAWELCRRAAELFPDSARALLEQTGAHATDEADCHEFLSYRALRRFLDSGQDEADAGLLERLCRVQGLKERSLDPTKAALLRGYEQEFGWSLPALHGELIGRYNELDLFDRGLRLLGVGGADESHDLFLFNEAAGWRRFYRRQIDGMLAFAFDAFGRVFLYDVPRAGERAPIVRLDVDFAEVEPVAEDFTEFVRLDLCDPEGTVARPRLLREWQARFGRLQANECLGYRRSTALGGARRVDNLITSELGLRLHIAGQVAEQVDQIPEGANIRGVRVIDQQELLVRVEWSDQTTAS